MAEVTSVNLFCVTIPNKTGEGAKALAALCEAGISFTAAWGYPVKGKKAQLDLVPADASAFSKAAKKLKLEVGKKKAAFFVSGEDHPGALAEVFAKLAGAGIGVHAAQATSAGAGRYGAIVQVADEDVKKAKKVLSK